MPRISVVVPIYNVERYLPACLDSVARQTIEDFEVVMVNDGSTDGSADLANEYSRRDSRFRLVHQENAGLSAARNTGIDAATGEFMAFLDSDDVLPPTAYELLLGALDETGSDFATGNVHRLTGWGTLQSPFLAKTFARTQLKTHVTRFRPLIADRIAWNKLWRRSFWDLHGYRFPVGMLHEDIPVVVPAQFAARSVDVIAEPVYLWRIREGGELSITQRRLEQRTLLDRIEAIERVSRHLAERGPRRAKRWYDESVVTDDLRLHVNLLDLADDAYRALFLDRVNAFLDGASARIYRDLPAIDRLKWHLVRRRLMPELLEVLRFEKEDLSGSAPVRVQGRWYGDYPFRGDARLRIPASVYRLRNADLPGAAHVEELRRDGDELKVRGFAYIKGIGAASPDSQRVRVTALRPGRLRRLRLWVSPLRLKTTAAVQRPDATAISRQPVSDLGWSGFEATLDPRALRRAGRLRVGAWELYVNVSAGGVRRRRARFVMDPARPLRAVELPSGEDGIVVAAPTEAAGVNLNVHAEWATVAGARLAGDDVLELSGELRSAPERGLALELRRRSDAKSRRVPVGFGTGGAPEAFTVRVPLADLAAAGAPAVEGAGVAQDEGIAWDLALAGDGRRVVVLLADAAEGGAWRAGGREVVLARHREGGAALVERIPRPMLTEARWSGDGVLELAGHLPADTARELVLDDAGDRGDRHVFPLEASGERFTSRLTPARIESIAGTLPLRERTWRLYTRAPGIRAEPGDPAVTQVMVAPALTNRLPLATTVAHKSFRLASTPDGCAALIVGRDLDDDERGEYHQRRLRATAYVARRTEPLRQAVVYASFGGRQYSDSPRAIHQELVRQGAPLEHLWVVRDGMCEVPRTATVLREGSREHHEAFARSRFIIANDHFPDWYRRRPDQTSIQTWHGTPLKRLGLDVLGTRRKVRRLLRGLDRQVDNWQYLVSPNRFSSPILRDTYGIEGEVLEIGYPRVDVLAAPDSDVRSRRVRSSLGLPHDARLVLYAPTYRDHIVDRRGRFRMEMQLDLERLRAAVGDDTVILFRKHHYVVDAVPETADGFVRDVSAYPDGTELMLAADVLITDYSSMTFDFANTRRPMLFFTYDLEAYRDEVRGLYLDLAAIAPGPLLRTTDEVAEALGDLDAVQRDSARRYDEFVSTFCSLDDGGASARVIERVIAW
ncbi:MAG TPA: CDP-glycerol glycerophosphotransferase family protein [Solirubrobacteraceae bacterium]|nr:CDP-glycerol glycerophosphotransferase family protein [Solirubrobacteraceae bacterium]